MSKQATINPLALAVGTLFLITMAGIQICAAAEPAIDPQIQAAQLLQRPQSWIVSTEGFQQSGSGTGKVIDPQEQARRVLQPVIVAAEGTSVVSGRFLAAESVDPQLQAARVLSRNLY